MKKLKWVFLFCLGMICANACASYPASNATACRIAFDYADPAVPLLNEQNARALLTLHCVCEPGSGVCKKR